MTQGKESLDNKLYLDSKLKKHQVIQKDYLMFFLIYLRIKSIAKDVIFN